MKILYYDCFSGISGDMNLGAMIDIGVDRNHLISELNKLNVKGWELIVERDQRHGINGTKVTVKQTRHEHAHRHLSDIEKIVNDSSLDPGTKELSKKIFMKVAQAEAKVHNVPLDHVHFHEVGAIDSIVDVVGAAICFNALNVEGVFVSPVELGGGFVKCDHGKLPVPAPATAEIVKGMTVRYGGVNFEATTPTGAAILAALGTEFSPAKPLRIEKTGYGIGQKENPDVPNILRVFLGETAQDGEKGHEALHLECNIDDMNPELYDYVSEKLFKAGAADVFLTNIIMKKGRPGIVLNVICEKGIAEAVKGVIFQETTSLGIRTIPFMKDTLVRKLETINTEFGAVNIKRSFFRDREVSVKPEYDDCKRIASEKNIPIKEVYNHILSKLISKLP
ncbi:MAG TPA: nickel pincer cofactor biosynthesis protein LarC [Bacteroidales bacterium]|nr:nickel pincer cofactor biosynthesis protein LarC [Bacteroidales bacterium]